MTLLIDISPTRFKYARLTDGHLGNVEVLVGGSSAAEPPWASALARLAPTPRLVYIANGGQAGFRQRLTEWIRRAWHIDPRFVELPKGGEPVASIERYLSLVGARARRLYPALVVNADVTVGVDLLDSDGQRAGSWTVPGERPMHEALYAQTSGVAAAALLDPAAVEGTFGVNTAGAVQAGSRLAIASWIAAIACRQNAQVSVVATGRLASEAIRAISSPAQVFDDLALEGLAHLVTEGLV